MRVIWQRLCKTYGFIKLIWKNFLFRHDRRRDLIANSLIMFSYGSFFVCLGFLSGAKMDRAEYTGELWFWTLGLAAFLLWVLVVPTVIYLIDIGIIQSQGEIWLRKLTVSSDTLTKWEPTKNQEVAVLRARAVIDGILGINNDYVINLFLYWLSDPIVRRGLHDHYDRQGYLVTFTETYFNYFYISLRRLRNLKKPIPRKTKQKTEEESAEPVKAKTMTATTSKPF